MMTTVEALKAAGAGPTRRRPRAAAPLLAAIALVTLAGGSAAAGTVAVLKLDAYGVSEAKGTMTREEIADQATIAGWTVVDRGSRLTASQAEEAEDCPALTGSCLDLICDVLAVDGLIFGTLQKESGGVYVTLRWHRRGKGEIEPVRKLAEGGDSGFARAIPTLVARLFAPAQPTPPPVTEEPPPVTEEPPPPVTEEPPPPPPEEPGEEPLIEPVTLRIVPRVGAILPRGQLGPNVLGALDIAYCLPLGGMLRRSFWIGLSAGFAALASTEDGIIPGRGLTSYVQDTRYVPISLDISYVHDRGWPVLPYVGIGGGLVMSRTRFLVFSETVTENDIAPAVVGFLGAQLPISLDEGVDGLLVVEGRHSEAWAEMGEMGDVGESSLGNTTVSLGFGLRF